MILVLLAKSDKIAQTNYKPQFSQIFRGIAFVKVDTLWYWQYWIIHLEYVDAKTKNFTNRWIATIVWIILLHKISTLLW